MPLSTPAPRKHIHTRQVHCVGYEREDGLWDIEGRMTDVKTYDMKNHDRGGMIPSGEPLHDMSIRLTINLDFEIQEVEAVIDYAPFNLCPSITEVFKKLEGRSIGPGWTRITKNLFSGTQGCTHLMELLGPIATTAFQATHLARTREAESSPQKSSKPVMLNTCHALADDGDVVKRFWPEHYQGTAQTTE
ncbi:MAG: DUF2889 domain-containing protein [Motiliproteus sp.]|nr:DUF2889 domain-containing protein [Motiliproteus sp.]MCW9052989.1 DUF2889 domain-containing protein [Motiliproteus sp.]